MTNLPKMPWPDPPKGQEHFYYSIGLLNPLLCQQQEIRVSKYTRILKVRNVKSRYGKALLGQEARQESQNLQDRVWNDDSFKSTTGSHTVYSAFRHLGVPLPGDNHHYYRRYEHSDSTIEVRFGSDSKENSNEMYEIADREFRNVMTSLRLIRTSSVKIIGPFAISAHLGAGVTSALSLGNPNDPILTSRPKSDRLLELTRADCTEIKRIFKALNSDLPPSVQLALRRMNLSITREAIEDQIVDAVVGLEALYLPEGDAELSYRLAIRSAAHQEANPKKRMEIFNKTKRLYEIRSKIVHGNINELKNMKRIKSGGYFSNEIDLLEYARNILREGCKSILLDLFRGNAWNTYHERIDRAALLGTKFSF